MRTSLCRKLGVGLATAALIASASPVWAQGSSGGSSSGGSRSGSSSGSGSGGTGGTSVTGNTETGVSSQNASLAGGFGQGTVTARSNSVSSANFLQQYFINPLSQGFVQGTNQTPTLSFGVPVFNMSGTGSGSSSGFGGSGGGSIGGRSGGSTFGGSSSGSFGGTSSIGGRSSGGSSSGGAFGSSFGGGSMGTGGLSGSSFGGSSGFGGSSSFGGIGGSRTGTTGIGGTAGARSGSTNGIMTYTSTNFGPTNGVRSPNMVTTLQFQAPPVAGFTPATPAVRNAQLQQVITRSTGFTVPPAVSVSNDGSTVVLRGRVANDEERRLAENMLKLTGVRDVRNELQVPATPAGNQ
jgi:hypothetical protein